MTSSIQSGLDSECKDISRLRYDQEIYDVRG